MGLGDEWLHLRMDGGVGARALVPETDDGGTTQVVALEQMVGWVDEQLRLMKHGGASGRVITLDAT